MSANPTVFVIGATGFIGKPLTSLLAFHGFDVMGLARTAEKARSLAQEGVEPVIGALDRPEEFATTMAKAEFLIDASQNNDDRAGHAKMVEAAAHAWNNARKAAGKPKGYFLYTSGTGVYGDLYEKIKRPLTEADVPTPPPFVAFRPALEQRIVTSNAWYGYVLRPGLVYGRQVRSRRVWTSSPTD
jgi:nucleoside-diphosphate-sugar epimerase